MAILAASPGKSQILIGGREGNSIYSFANNKITYNGSENCEKLTAKIEGYDKEFKFIDCTIEIRHLKVDSSKIEIINQEGVTVFDTILVRNLNEAKAYLQIGEKLLLEGMILKSELTSIDGLSIRYACPWMDERPIIGFGLILVDKNGEYLLYEILGNKIPEKYKSEMLMMKDPIALYIENIRWRSISCNGTTNSIVLEIK